MKRMRRRLVSILLIIAILTTMLPVQVFATELEDEAPANIVTESEPIEALRVASQPDFSFTTVSGKVVDSQGTGVSGVSVMLYNLDENTTLSQCVTDATGSWVSADYDAIVGYTYIISYYKTGYEITPNNIEVTALSGGTTVEAVTATPLDIGDLVCNEGDYTYTIDTENATIKKYTGSDTAILLPSKLGGYPVVAIGNSAFEDNKTVQTVCLSENITKIGNYAFENCSALSTIYFSNGLTAIGSYAFQNCTALTGLSLPNGLLSIGSYAFYGCTGFTNIKLPDSVATINSYAFMNCSNLESINFPASWSSAGGSIFNGCTKLTSMAVPEGVVTIPNSAFENANCLKSITLPSTLNKIGSYAFENCKVLDTINFPDGLTAIGSYAFQNCTALTGLSLPNGLLSIGSYAFYGCTGFTNIKLPDSVATINSYAFMNCSNLESINFPASWSSAGGSIFNGCTKLTSMAVPEGVVTIPNSAFENANCLKSITLPSTLNKIGSYAFENCKVLDTINFPDGLTAIGNRAFYGCSSITSIDLPDSVATINSNAFQNCTKVSSFDYPTSWTSAGSGIFSGCTKLTGITVPEGVTVIPNYAFENANCLKSISLPSTLEAVGNYTFENCTAFEQVTIPSGVKSIGNYAFSGCMRLERIWIGENVSSIAANTFNNCSQLTIHGVSGSYAETYATSKSIPFSTEELNYDFATISGYVVDSSGSGVEGVSVSVYDEAKQEFAVTSLLTDVNGAWTIDDATIGSTYIIRYYKSGYMIVPNNIQATALSGGTTVETVTATPLDIDDLVCNAADYSYTIDTEKATITKYTGSDTALLLPSELGGYPVVAIGSSAFEDNKTVQTVCLSDNITSIGSYAFENCSALSTIYFSNGLTTINSRAFYNCVGLTDLSLPNSLTTIGSQAFYGCTGFTNIDLPDSITTINGNAFQNCSNLESINYPASWSSAGGGIFNGCTKLTSMDVPEGVTSIPSSAFENANCLKSISLPSTLKTIGSYAFENCKVLDMINFPEGLTTIGNRAFYGCSSITSIDLPDSVATINSNAFQNCTKASSFDYPTSWTTAGSGIFNGCTKLTSIVVPEGVATIPNSAFENANCLKSVTLPDTLEAVGTSAFEGASQLRCAILPTSVTSIGNYAFSNCSQLRYIMASGESCAIGSDAFKNSPKMLLYSNMNSMSTVHAIRNSIPFIATETSATLPTGVFDRSATSYFADISGASTNGYVTLTAQLCVLEDLWTNSSSRKIEIHVPNGTELIESTLKLNGSLCQDFTLDEQTLFIPITQRENTVKFSVRVLAQGDLTSYALFSYYKDRKTSQSVVGIINEGMESFTLSAEELTSEQQIRIEGVAPASAAVSVFVDGTQVTTLTASKAGSYTGSILLNSVADEKTYVISASCTGSDGNLLSASQTVTYEKSAPVLTGFTFYIDNGSQVVDLYSMAQQGIRPSITHTGSKYPYKFVINFKNPESIDKLYVTSTRSNVKKSIDAVYDDALGAFVAIGHFDESNTLYVPGSLGVEYTLKHEEALVGQDVDWTDLQNRISKELRENTTVTSETNGGTTTGTIDFSKVEESLADTALDYTIKAFDESAGTSINDLLGLAETEANIFSYIVPGMDDSRYLVLLDFRDPSTYTMIVGDALSVADTAVELTLSMTEFSDPSYVSLFDLSTKLSNYSTAVGVVSKTFGIISDCDSLRNEIMQSSSIEDTSAALKKVDELESDRLAFMLLTTALPLIVGSGGVMAGPTLLFGAMVGVMVSMSDIFWQLRVSEIKGEDYKIKWHIDPSGYVYDVDTGLPIPDVTTTVYCIEYDDSEDFWDTPPLNTDYGTKWNAAEHNQNNPLITDANGCYAWDVPEGWWRVKYEKDGYVTVWSDWLPVPPPQTEVNIGMVSTVVEDYAVKKVSSTATSAAVSLTNNTASSAELQFVVAAYLSNGQMISCTAASATLKSTESTSITISIPNATPGVVLKAFVLDKNHAPLRDAWSAKFS